MKRMITILLGVLLAFTYVAAAAAADGPVGPVGPDNGVFLCPIVGDGLITADGHNGENGVSLIPQPPAGISFLPGNNQAGAHANHNAYNSYLADGAEGPGGGPPVEDNNPGDNPDFTPIWNT